MQTTRSTTSTATLQEANAWAIEALPNLLSEKAIRVPAGPAQNSAWGAPGAISLTGGVPDPESLPADAIAEAFQTVLRREHKPALEYGGPQGFEPLREYVATRVYPVSGVKWGAENVTLTSGSSHGLANILETFVDPGDVVIVELPSFSGALRTFRAGGADLVGVPMDDDGIDTQALDDTLNRLEKEGRKAKFIYTIQNFHNPLGITQNLERRHALIEVAARHHVLIVDDDPYGEFRFRGDTLPSLLSLSGGEGVLGVGTFSKIIATGLRAAWIQGQKEYIDRLVSTRFDGGTSPLTLRMIAAYIEAGHLEPHVEKMAAIYRDKCDTMLRALDERCSSYVTFTRPEGGFFIWAELQNGAKSPELARIALAEGVGIVPGTGFMAEPELGKRYFRLAFSYVPEAQIFEAIQRLGRALEKAG
ncbi:MAG: PLP-dependent aminotransferase family protein [Dehalococcoidia bacterium]